ncbi:hypothetical protein IEQ34_015986 [Dendrobium chrysotoxum]|uniref:Ubiquitin-like protease family profile domain-containing protein n=1 Tax=Dendrobium chrysotoxum TaxID=161865 RepID=A0AAV7G297_DENCH|nr:hypothetical protein IEQ34_015986 [Dendrobium chrysotoxum]
MNPTEPFVPTVRPVRSSRMNPTEPFIPTFSPFQQCVPLLYRIPNVWITSDEGFIINGHLLKFTSYEVALLTDVSPPPPTTDVSPLPPTIDVAPPPPTIDVAPPPPTTDVAPPPPTRDVAPRPPTTDASPIQSKLSATTPEQIIQYQPHKLKRRRDDKKPSKRSKKPISTHDIKFLHEDMEGAFTSDITKWNLQTVRGIPTQSNDVDYGMFVYKFLEKATTKESGLDLL